MEIKCGNLASSRQSTKNLLTKTRITETAKIHTHLASSQIFLIRLIETFYILIYISIYSQLDTLLMLLT